MGKKKKRVNFKDRKYSKFFEYRFPNRKLKLLTDEFLTSFRDELDKVFNSAGSTYKEFYIHMGGTGGFYDALKEASIKHNVKKAIYDYACYLPWYQSDLLDDELMQLMVNRGIIKEGEFHEVYGEVSEERFEELKSAGAIDITEKVREYKGYRVIVRDWEFNDVYYDQLFKKESEK